MFCFHGCCFQKHHSDYHHEKIHSQYWHNVFCLPLVTLKIHTNKHTYIYCIYISIPKQKIKAIPEIRSRAKGQYNVCGCNWTDLYGKGLKFRMLPIHVSDIIKKKKKKSKSRGLEKMQKDWDCRTKWGNVGQDPVPQQDRDNWSCIQLQPHTSKPSQKETVTSIRLQPGSCDSEVPTLIILLLNKSYTSYLAATGQNVLSDGALICILTDHSVSITGTYDGLPHTVVKKLLSNRHVVRFHSPRA